MNRSEREMARSKLGDLLKRYGFNIGLNAMMTEHKSGAFLVLLCLPVALFALIPEPALGQAAAMQGEEAARAERRLDLLEARLAELEGKVATLTREKANSDLGLERQKAENSDLKSQLVLASAATHRSVEADREDPPSHPLVNSYGVRAGYQGFPFGQREGGFFYGVAATHRLIGETTRMPLGGALDLEVGAGVGRSGSDKLIVNSAVAGGLQKIELRQRMISIWPGLKYSFNRFANYGVSPYLTGGPGIWIDIIETPPLVGGLQFPTKELGGRKLPTTAGASLFEGAQGGAGMDFSFARFNQPVLDRMKLGFDYRYAAWTTGQRFSTYSLLLSYSD